MNISELEKVTGITKQNIRFYEKKELLHPVRNEANRYREYTKEDLRTLQIIKILRKLDLPIEEIRKVLSEEIPLSVTMEQHLEMLEQKREELNACIDICKCLQGMRLESLDVEETLEKMEEMERKGGMFMSIVQDYKKFVEAEHQNHFSFKPDTMAKNPDEFAQALFQYANENGLKLVITKGGMYPVFEIDGVEYTAHRTFDRFGATIHCSRTDAAEAEIPRGKKILYRIFHGPVIWMILLVLFMAVDRRSIGAAVLVACMLGPYLIWVFWGTRERR